MAGGHAAARLRRVDVAATLRVTVETIATAGRSSVTTPTLHSLRCVVRRTRASRAKHHGGPRLCAVPISHGTDWSRVFRAGVVEFSTDARREAIPLAGPGWSGR